MEAARVRALAARLAALDIERIEIADELAGEAMRRGVETAGQDALYQAWWLGRGTGLRLAVRWLRTAAAEMAMREE
jgi:hypothetical protein